MVTISFLWSRLRTEIRGSVTFMEPGCNFCHKIHYSKK